MKFLKQTTIILLFSFMGEVLHDLLPLPVPASIYGMVLLFAALQTGALSASSIRETGSFLIEIMPVMFIPAAVGLLDSWEVLRPVFLPFALLTVVATPVVMVTAGRVTQSLLRPTEGMGNK